MPNIPFKYALTNAAPDIFNAIRNEATMNYRDYVPVATPDAESLRTIGSILMDSPDLRNQFVQTLINRIAKVIVTSKLYDNPWAVFKRGVLDYGEVVENIFVEISTAHQYDPDTAENTVWKREVPDVRTSFSVMNFQKFYKQTIDDKQLSLALMSWDGVTDFISRIISAMYTAANYDEFLVMKYMIAKNILNNKIKVQQVTNSTMAGLVTQARSLSNLFTFMSTNYNAAGVHTYTDKRNQYIIIPAQTDAEIDVDVLAAAFNMDKAEFFGHRILVDNFNEFDNNRLAELLGNNPDYVPFTTAELNYLGTQVGAVILDSDWFMIFDNFIEMASLRNPEGISWNYWLHVWKTFGINPYANAVALVITPGSFTAFTIGLDPEMPNGSTTNPVAGEKFYLTALTYTGDNQAGANKEVTWTSNNDRAVVSNSGVVTIVDDSGAKTATITATSVANPSVKATYTITFAAAVT